MAFYLQIKMSETLYYLLIAVYIFIVGSRNGDGEERAKKGRRCSRELFLHASQIELFLTTLTPTKGSKNMRQRLGTLSLANRLNSSAPSTPTGLMAPESTLKVEVTANSTLSPTEFRSPKEFRTFNFDDKVEGIVDEREKSHSVSRDVVEEREEASYGDLDNFTTVSSMTVERMFPTKRVKDNEVESSGDSQQDKGPDPLSTVSNKLAKFSAKYMALELAASRQENRDLMDQIKALETHVKALQDTRHGHGEAKTMANEDSQEAVSKMNEKVEKMQAQDDIKTQMVNKFAEEVKQKTKDIQSLQHANNDLKGELERTADEKKKREEDLVFCIHQLEEAQNATKALTMQGEGARKEITSLIERLNDLDERNRLLESKSPQQKNHELLKEIESLKALCVKQQSKVKHTTDGKKKREEDLAFSVGQLQEAQKENKTLALQKEEACSEAQEACRKHESEMEEARKEIKSLIERVDDLKGKNRMLESKNHEESLDKETRRSSMTIVSTQLSTANARCAVLEMEHQELKDSLEAEVAKQAQVLQYSQEKYEELVTEKNKILESKCHEESLDKETRRSSMTIVSTQLSAANARCAVLEMEHEELKDSLEAEIAKQAQELLESQDQYKALKAQNQELAQELKNDLASERARSKALDSEVECLKEQREVFQADAHLREALKASETELEVTNNEVGKLQKMITHAESSNKALQNDLANEQLRSQALVSEVQFMKEQQEVLQANAYLREAHIKANLADLELGKGQVQKLLEVKGNLEAQIAKHVQELQDSKEKYEDTKARIQELVSQGESLDNTNKELTDDLADERAHSQALGSKIQSLKEQCETFQGDAYLREAHIKTNETELEVTKREVGELQEQIIRTESLNKSLHNDLETQQARSRALGAEVQSLKDQSAAFQAEAKAEVEFIKEEFEKLQANITNAETTNKSLTKSLAETKDRYALLKTEFKYTMTKFKEASAKSEEIQDLMASRENELEESKTNNGNLNDQVKEKKATILSLENANEHLSNDLVESSGRCSALSNETNVLKDQLKALKNSQTENQSTGKKIEELEEKIGKLESTNLKLNINLTNSNKRYSDLISIMEGSLLRNGL